MPALVTRLAPAARWLAWGAAGALTLAALAQPVGPGAQLALAGLAIAGMAAIARLMPRGPLARTGVVALASLVVLRYVYWRVTATLPSLDDPLGFGLGLALLVAELHCVAILAISLVINADPLTRAPVPCGPDADLPTVDVLVPTYDEDLAILGVTLSAARALDYPAARLTVWLLDDGGTDAKCTQADAAKAAAARARRAALQDLCATLGVRYLTRAENLRAKAGNLNNGLEASSGEIVVVLDADHAPFRSFLRATIGHFAQDPRLFLVQTPHVFLNPDPVEKNLRTFGAMPSESAMFYDVTQRGLDKWNASFFCGSAALLRRAALAETGGFSGITVTEDCETALELHARGWTSVYVDTALIAGLQPETFADFIGQRSRWCQGMFQILMLKNPGLRRGLRPIQRLAYLSSMLFWFFPLPRLAFMLAPLLHVFFDVKIFVSSLDEAVAYTATYVVASTMLQHHLYGHVRWPWVSELYEYVQGVHLVRAIAAVVAAPRKPRFNVTAKGVLVERDGLSGLAGPFLAIFALLAAGVATAAWRYAYEPGATSLMLVVGLWCLFNLVIAGAALGVVAERRPEERVPGLAVDRRGVLALADRTLPVAITRISPVACHVRPLAGGAAPAAGVTGTLQVETADARVLPGLPVAVTDAGEGTWTLALTNLAAREYPALAEAMYGDAAAIARFLEARRRPMSFTAGSLRVLAWSVTEPVRASGYAVGALRDRFRPAIAPVVAAPAAVEATVVAVPVEVVAPSVIAGPAAAVAPPVADLDGVPSLTSEAWRVAIEALGAGETTRASETIDDLTPETWAAALATLARKAAADAAPATRRAA